MSKPRCIATDDRLIERSPVSCSHRKCSGGPCRAYSEETLKITEADEVLAQRMVAEGWMRTSNRYRTVIRFTTPPPSLSEVCSAEFLSTVRGKRLSDWYERCLRYEFQHGCEDLPHEEAVLSPSLFRAFVRAGGRCA